MQLAFQISVEVRASLRASNFTGSFWEDITLPLNIGSISALWLRSLEQSSFQTVELRHALEALYEASQSISIALRGASLELLSNFLRSGQYPHERDLPADGFHLNEIFRHIENCDNLVISDRVAIFANIAELDWRINTTGLSSNLIRLPNEVDFEWPFVLRINIISLMDRSLQLKELIRNGHENIHEDLQAIDRVLENYVPPEARAHDTTQALAADFREGGRLHNILPSLFRQAENLKAATIIPLSATIEDLFGGIIRDTSLRRADLSRSHGDKLASYVSRGVGVEELSRD